MTDANEMTTLEITREVRGHYPDATLDSDTHPVHGLVWMEIVAPIGDCIYNRKLKVSKDELERLAWLSALSRARQHAERERAIQELIDWAEIAANKLVEKCESYYADELRKQIAAVRAAQPGGEVA